MDDFSVGDVSPVPFVEAGEAAGVVVCFAIVFLSLLAACGEAAGDSVSELTGSATPLPFCSSTGDVGAAFAGAGDGSGRVGMMMI